MRTHMALRLVLSAAVATAIAAPVFAEDASGGPEKSIAPKSLSNQSLSNQSLPAPASTSGSSSSSQDAKDAGSGGSAPSDAARKAGGSPQGRNNTMDDS